MTVCIDLLEVLTELEIHIYIFVVYVNIPVLMIIRCESIVEATVYII